MKRLLFIVALASLVTGCANSPAPVTMGNDWRTGTDYSPYRTVGTVLQCNDCKY